MQGAYFAYWSDICSPHFAVDDHGPPRLCHGDRDLFTGKLAPGCGNLKLELLCCIYTRSCNKVTEITNVPCPIMISDALLVLPGLHNDPPGGQAELSCPANGSIASIGKVFYRVPTILASGRACGLAARRIITFRA